MNSKNSGLRRRHLHVEDVAAIGGDHGHHRRQAARLVLHPHRDPGHRRAGFGRILAPAHIQPVVHVLRLVEFGAVDGVDHHALARRHQADDAVARQRMAAWRQRIGNAFGQAADGDRLGGAIGGTARPDAALLGALELGKDRLQHFVAAQRAAPDIGIDILGLGQAQLLGHFADRLLGQFARPGRQRPFPGSCWPNFTCSSRWAWRR